MPEAMLPVIVLVRRSERGRSDRAYARVEHGANYAGIGDLSAWKVVVGVGRGHRVRRLCELVGYFSSQELSEVPT
jgi:hypothetical protein